MRHNELGKVLHAEWSRRHTYKMIGQPQATSQTAPEKVMLLFAPSLFVISSESLANCGPVRSPFRCHLSRSEAVSPSLKPDDSFLLALPSSPALINTYMCIV